MFLPDRRHQRIDFFEANRKPHSPFKINLNACSIPPKSAFNLNTLYPYDLVGNLNRNVVEPVGVNLTVGELGGEEMVIMDGSASHQIDLNDSGNDLIIDDSDSYSILHRFVFSGPTQAEEFTISSNYSGLSASADTLVFGDSTIEDGRPHTLLMTRTDSAIRFFMDGSLLGEQTTVTTGRGTAYFMRYDSQFQDWEIFWQEGNGGPIFIGGNPQRTGDRWDGGISFSCFWQGELPEPECIAVTQDWKKLIQVI